MTQREYEVERNVTMLEEKEKNIAMRIANIEKREKAV